MPGDFGKALIAIMMIMLMVDCLHLSHKQAEMGVGGVQNSLEQAVEKLVG